MKDRNLLTCKRIRQTKDKPGLLQFYHEDIKVIRDHVEKDTKFLEAHDLLDYSLLLTIEFIPVDQTLNKLNNTMLS